VGGLGVVISDLERQQMLAYEENRKSLGIAYVFLFLFGWLGGHKFYLAHYFAVAFYVIMFITGFIFGFPWVILGICVIVDIFILNLHIKEYNRKVYRQVYGKDKTFL
jgi:TM2 domain-containing membrane protein YozV